MDSFAQSVRVAAAARWTMFGWVFTAQIGPEKNRWKMNSRSPQALGVQTRQTLYFLTSIASPTYDSYVKWWGATLKRPNFGILVDVV